MHKKNTNKKMAKKLIVGNWKMHPASIKDALRLFKEVGEGISTLRNTEVIVAAPFLYLEKLTKVSKKISLAAQNSFYGDTGAFTGEVSPGMLESIGVKYVILGHSERRAMGENNVLINKKIKSVLAVNLTPILCIGETERDLTHSYFETVRTQVRECLLGINKNLISKIIFAYEPVWALSSTPGRRDATAHDSNEMAIFIRKTLSDISTPAIAATVKIIYGGSVNEKDAGEFLQNGGVDGVLPGKASLSADKFIKIISSAEHVIKKGA